MIPHNKPCLGKEEEDAAKRVISSSWLAQGKEVASFENELCDFLDLPEQHAVAVSSGTSALFLALWSLGAKGKKVGMPVYACAALPNAVEMAQAHSIFFDCSDTDPNIDFGGVAKQEPHILIAPSMFGIPVQIPESKGYSVIEDLAQALGSSDSGKKLGSFGDVAICSFYATKMITSGGQGGAVVSKDKSLIEAVKDYREFDCREDQRHRFNFQMTDLQAAMGRAQLKKLPSFISKRQDVFDLYKDKGLNMLEERSEKTNAVKYRAVLKCSDPESIKKKLLEQNIQSIIPIEKWELLGQPTHFPNALNLTKSTLSLPIHPNISIQDAAKIADIISEIT